MGVSNPVGSFIYDVTEEFREVEVEDSRHQVRTLLLCHHVSPDNMHLVVCPLVVSPAVRTMLEEQPHCFWLLV